MTRCLLAMLALVLLSVPPSAQARGCSPGPGERVVERGRDLVVLRHRNGRVAGCVRDSGRRRRLVERRRHAAYDVDFAGVDALAGTNVVYGYSIYEGAGSTHYVVATDVRSGRGSLLTQFAVTGYGVDDVVLRRDGALAFIRAWYSGPGRNRYDVIVCRVRSCDEPEEHVADPGPAVDPQSLRRAGDRVCWTASGAERCTALPGA